MVYIHYYSDKSSDTNIRSKLPDNANAIQSGATMVKAIQKKMVPGQVEDGKKLAAAEELDFEKAVRLRNWVEKIRKVYRV